MIIYKFLPFLECIKHDDSLVVEARYVGFCLCWRGRWRGLIWLVCLLRLVTVRSWTGGYPWRTTGMTCSGVSCVLGRSW